MGRGKDVALRRLKQHIAHGRAARRTGKQARRVGHAGHDAFQAATPVHAPRQKEALIPRGVRIVNQNARKPAACELFLKRSRLSPRYSLMPASLSGDS